MKPLHQLADFAPVRAIRPVTESFGETRADGSLLVSAEQLARLGGGDPKRGRRELRLLLAAERERTLPHGPVTDKPATIRIAGPDDEPNLLELIKIDVDENAAHVAPPDDERILTHIQIGTRKRGGIVGVIDGKQGKPIAMCLIYPEQWWWSNSYHLVEGINFVHPDHRKSHHIDDLLKFERWVGDTWSKSFGYRLYMIFCVLGTKRVREKILLYRRKFAMTGAFFLYPSPFSGE